MGGIPEIQSHAWFKNTDWKMIYDKKSKFPNYIEKKASDQKRLSLADPIMEFDETKLFQSTRALNKQ